MMQRGQGRGEVRVVTRRVGLKRWERPVILPCLERTKTYGTFLSSQSSGR